MTDEDSEPKHYELNCTLGSLQLSVEGTDKEWVRQTFQEEWAERMSEAEDIEQALRDGSRAHQ